MNQRQLTYFIEVYHARSIKRAAKKLMISAQGLSRTIISLEQEYGELLFERANNRLTPTEAADELIVHAYAIVEEFQMLQNHRKPMKKVTIFTIEGIFEYLSSGFLPAFYKQYPDISLEINVVPNRLASEYLQADKGDLAFLQYPFQLKGVYSKFLFSYPYCFVISKENPLSEKDKLTPKDLDGQNLAGRGSNYELFKNYIFHLNKQGSYPVIRLETNNQQLLVKMAEENLAIAAVSRHMAQHCKSDRIRTIAMEEEETADRIFVAYRETKKMKPETKCFLDFLDQWLQRQEESC